MIKRKQNRDAPVSEAHCDSANAVADFAFQEVVWDFGQPFFAEAGVAVVAVEVGHREHHPFGF